MLALLWRRVCSRCRRVGQLRRRGIDGAMGSQVCSRCRWVGQLRKHGIDGAMGSQGSLRLHDMGGVMGSPVLALRWGRVCSRCLGLGGGAEVDPRR